jgi:hypothetical protein
MTRSFVGYSALIVALSSLVVACGSSSDSGGAADTTGGGAGTGTGATGGSSAGTSSTGGGTATGGASATGGTNAAGGNGTGGTSAGGSSAGGSGGAPPTKGGTVNLGATLLAPGMYSNSVTGTFFATLSAGATSPCTTEVMGACTVSQCDFSGGTGGAPATPALEAAGTLTVTGAAVPISITGPGMAGNYMLTTPNLPANMPLFAGTEMLTISASGAAAPAFSGQLAAPAAIKISQPKNGAFSISTSQDFALAWTGGTAGKAFFSISATKVSGAMISNTANIACNFAASSGTGTVPVAALQKLTSVQSPTIVSFTASAISSTNFIVDGSSIVLQALAGPQDANGAPFKAMPTLN